MKTQNLLKTFLLAGVCALALSFSNTANAATQTWNPGGAGGGNGSWSASNWDSAAAWTANNTAVFGGTAGTVTNTTQAVSGLTFNTAGYILSAGTLTVNSTLTTFTTNFANASDKADLTAITLTDTGAAAAITKTGKGTLALNNASGGLGGTTPATVAVWTVTGGTLVGSQYDSILSVSGGNNLGANPAGAVQLILDAGTFITTGNSANGRNFQVNAAGGTIQMNGANNDIAANIANNADSSHTLYVGVDSGHSWTIGAAAGQGVISGNGSLTKFDVGTLTLSGVNTYTGGTILNQGTLTVGSVGTLGASTGALAVNNTNSTAAGTASILNLTTSGNTTTGSLSGTIATPISGTNTATINTQTGRNFTVNQTVSGTYAGVIAGNGTFTKTGAASLTLTGINTYAGNTTISAGALSIATTSALPGWDTGGKYSVASGATLAVYNAVTSGNITTMLGTGNFAAGAALGFDTTTANRTYSAVLANTGSGALGLTKLGANTLILDQTNTYNGTTTISAGTLQIGNGTDAGSISATGSISNAGALVYNVGGGNRTLGAVISGNGTLTQSSSGGTLVLTANNTYTGNTTISAGTLQIGNGTDSGSIATSGGIANEGALVYNVGAGNRTVPIIGGNGSLTQSGTGVLHLNQANIFKGGVTVNSGTLGITAGSSLGSPATTTFAGNGTLQFENNIAIVISSARTFAINSGMTATIDTQSFNGTIASLISGNGSLKKSGTGVLTLTGNNTYTGATTVSTGTLLVNGSTSTSSAVTVNVGATLGGGNGTVGGFATVNGDLKPGNNNPGVLTFSSGLTLNGTTTMEINGSTTPGTDFDKVAVTSGTTTLGGTLAFSFGNLLTNNVPINLFPGTSLGNFSGVTSTGSYSGPWSVGVAGDTWTFTDGTQTLTFSEVTGTLNVIPEPATWALLAFSLTTMTILRRRRS